MNYKGYILKLFFRILLLVVAALGLVYFTYKDKTTYAVIISIVILYLLINTYTFVKRRFMAMDDFFEAVKYRDFSRWFPDCLLYTSPSPRD